MKKFLSAIMLLSTSSIFAATVNLSGNLPQGIVLESISSYYRPENQTYGCSSGETKRGKISISNGKFTASVGYEPTIGSFLCKKKISSISLNFRVERREGNIIQTEDMITTHSLDFRVAGDGPNNSTSIRVTCERNRADLIEDHYDVFYAREASTCRPDRELTLPLKGSSNIAGIHFNVLDLEPVDIEDSNLERTVIFEQSGLVVDFFKNGAGTMEPLSMIRVRQAPQGSLLMPGNYRVKETLFHTDGTLLKIRAGGRHINQKHEVNFEVTTLNSDPRLKFFRVESWEYKCAPQDSKVLLVSQQDERFNWTKAIHCSM